MEVSEALRLAKEIKAMEIHNAATKLLEIYYAARREGVADMADGLNKKLGEKTEAV